MAASIELIINGKPLGKQRVKASNRGGIIKLYTPEQTLNWETYTKTLFLAKYPNHEPWSNDIPLKLIITSYFKKPKWTKKQQNAFNFGLLFPTVKPDFDNIAKIVADSLNGLAYNDDKQIVEASIKKNYSDFPRVEISIYPIIYNLEI